MKRIVLAALVLLIPIAASAYKGSSAQPTVATSMDSRQDAQDSIQVFNGPIANQPFIVVGEIHDKGSTEKVVMGKMKTLALKNGANAILSYKVEAGTMPSQWTGAILVNASGVAVRWAKDGEKGVTKIAADTAIPVIQ